MDETYSEAVDKTKLSTTAPVNSGATRIIPFDLEHLRTTSGTTTPWGKLANRTRCSAMGSWAKMACPLRQLQRH